jgi:hypothetical protein
MLKAPSKYPSALTVFIVPAKVYDQPKSERMAGSSNPYENRVTPSEMAAPSAKTIAKAMLSLQDGVCGVFVAVKTSERCGISVLWGKP